MNNDKIQIESEKPVLCTTAESVFEVDSQNMLERAAQDYFERMGITVLDLFYSLDEQKKIQVSGTYSQDIIQKIARAQIKLTTASVSARMKTLWELVEQIIQNNQVRQRNYPPIDLKVLQNPDALLPFNDENQIEFSHRILCSIVKTALLEEDSVSRFNIILECANRLANQENVVYFDAYLAKVIHLNEIKKNFIRSEDSLFVQIQILLEGLKGGDIPCQFLEKIFSFAETWRLSRIPEAILELSLERLDEREPIVDGLPRNQFDALCEIYELTQNLAMSAFKRGEFQIRIERRLRQIVNNETIEDFMGEAPDILERIQILVALQNKLPSETLTQFIQENIENLFTDGFFLSQLRHVSGLPIEITKKLARTVRTLIQLKLPQSRLSVITSQIEKYQCDLIDRMHILDTSKLTQAEIFARFKLIAGLIIDDSIVSESYKTHARKVLEKMLKSPNFVEVCFTGLSNKTAKVERARDLHDLILRAGLAT